MQINPTGKYFVPRQKPVIVGHQNTPALVPYHLYHVYIIPQRLLEQNDMIETLLVLTVLQIFVTWKTRTCDVFMVPVWYGLWCGQGWNLSFHYITLIQYQVQCVWYGSVGQTYSHPRCVNMCKPFSMKYDLSTILMIHIYDCTKHYLFEICPDLNFNASHMDTLCQQIW